MSARGSSAEGGAHAGLAAVAIAFFGIASAILTSPAFSLTANALSDLGAPGNPAASPATTLFFDGGLVLAGIVGMPFVGVLWGRRPLERLAAVPFAVAMLGMAGVGMFPIGTVLHTPAALTLYSGAIVAAGVYGAGIAATGDIRRGVATVGLALAHLGVWAAWAAAGPVTRPGVAIPELAGAGLFAAWVCWTAARHLSETRGVSDAETGPNS